VTSHIPFGTIFIFRLAFPTVNEAAKFHVCIFSPSRDNMGFQNSNRS